MGAHPSFGARLQGLWSDIRLPHPLTCGLVVRSPEGLLMGHSTGRQHWDLPKGKRERGEAPLCAALRECREETGLDLTAFRNLFVDLGHRPYRPRHGKVLHLFTLDLAAPLDLSCCRCETQVSNRGPRLVPDMDQWAWVPEDQVASRCRRAMRRHLINRGLINDASLRRQA